jgi:hypothetical protein
MRLNTTIHTPPSPANKKKKKDLENCASNKYHILHIIIKSKGQKRVGRDSVVGIVTCYRIGRSRD